MGVFDNFPYTNIHDLNTDWLVKTVKDVKNKTDEIDNAVINAEEYAELSKEYYEKLQDTFITPEMFGAVGDGITDDTTAIIDAFNYCKTNNKNLYSFNKKYKTTSNCVLTYNTNNFFNIYLNGEFDYIELRGNPLVMYDRNIYIHKADIIKFINFVGLHAHIDSVNNFYLIGDNLIGGNGACAYNYFTGIHYVNIYLQAFNSGWVNENKFYCMRCVDITIEGNTNHYADNNSFYDICLENSNITFNRAQSNYIRYRGEGTINKNSTYSFNNIAEYTWVSTKNGYGITTENDGLITSNRWSSFIQTEKLLSLNVDKIYHNNNDYTKRTFYVAPNTTIGRHYIKPDQDCFWHLLTDARVTIYIAVFDSDMTNITTASMNGTIFKLPGATLSGGYFSLSGQTVSEMDIPIYKQSTNMWVYIGIGAGSNGLTAHTIETTIRYFHPVTFIAIENLRNASASLPTNTGLPKGTFIQDSSGNTKGWVYTNNGWEALT